MIDGSLLPGSRRASVRLSRPAGFSGAAGDVRARFELPRTPIDGTTRDTTPGTFERTHWWADTDGSTVGNAVGWDRCGSLTTAPELYDELTSAYD